MGSGEWQPGITSHPHYNTLQAGLSNSEGVTRGMKADSLKVYNEGQREWTYLWWDHTSIITLFDKVSPALVFNEGQGEYGNGTISVKVYQDKGNEGVTVWRCNSLGQGEWTCLYESLPGQGEWTGLRHLIMRASLAGLRGSIWTSTLLLLLLLM